MPFKARVKKLLIDLHLYLGVVLCLFFAAWFVSGIAMMYYTTPILQPRERHALARPMPWKGIKLDPAEAARRAGWKDEALREARLGELLGRPVLRAWPSAKDSGWKAVYLDDGSPVRLDRTQAEAVAVAALGGSWVHTGMQGPRNWTQHGALNPHAQAFHFKAGDGSSRQVLVSQTTGDPILLTHKGFYLLYWLGPIVHYYTLKPFRDYPAFWRNLVDWSSGLGTFMVLLGLVLGIWFLRWDRLPSEPKKAVPYSDTWMWLHHVFGMLFGVLTFTFVLSGLFSMNPMKIFPSTSVEEAQREKFAGAGLRPSDMKGLAALARQAPRAHEVSLSSFEGGLAATLWSQGGGAAATLRRGPQGWQAAPALAQAEVERALRRGFPGGSLKSLELLEKQDAYYYERPEKRRWRQYPVYRAQIEGKPDITLYLAPSTGEILLKHSPGSKLRRWLYNGLHSFDFMPFYYRPWWDIIVILMCLGGLALSVTGVVLSWKWLAGRLSSPPVAAASQLSQGAS